MFVYYEKCTRVSRDEVISAEIWFHHGLSLDRTLIGNPLCILIAGASFVLSVEVDTYAPGCVLSYENARRC